MTEEELHNEAHINAEHDVREALYATFYGEEVGACRAAVLLEVLKDEFMQLSEEGDILGVIYAMLEMVRGRDEQDNPLFYTVGSA